MEMVRAKGWVDLNSREAKVKRARMLGIFEEAIEDGCDVAEASFRAGALPKIGRKLLRLYRAG